MASGALRVQNRTHFSKSVTRTHGFAMHSTLIAPAELATLARDINWLVVDCRFELTRPAAGA